MTGNRPGLSGRADELRRAFDRSFVGAPRNGVESLVDLLAIRIAGDPYAFHLVDVAGLFVDRVVTPLPTPAPELLGLAGFRATLVPVYDLGALLGYAGGSAPRWMVSTAGDATVGLAFDQFDAHLRVPPDALASDETHARSHVRQVVRTSEGVRPVVDLRSVLEVVSARAQSLRLKER